MTLKGFIALNFACCSVEDSSLSFLLYCEPNYIKLFSVVWRLFQRTLSLAFLPGSKRTATLLSLSTLYLNVSLSVKNVWVCPLLSHIVLTDRLFPRFG